MDIEEIKELYKKYNCTLLEEHFKQKSKMKFRCKCDNECCKTFKNFLINQNCIECNKKNEIKITRKTNLNDIILYLKNLNNIDTEIDKKVIRNIVKK
jgi:hypothetical protein